MGDKDVECDGRPCRRSCRKVVLDEVHHTRPVPAGPALQEHYAEAVFTFNKLCFGAPSHMRPRWLVFAASLLGGGCVYSHYLVSAALPAVPLLRAACGAPGLRRVLRAKMVHARWGTAPPSWLCSASRSMPAVCSSPCPLPGAHGGDEPAGGTV